MEIAGVDYGCRDSGGNCLPDTEVRDPLVFDVFSTLFWMMFDKLTGGIAPPGPDEEIQEFFGENYEVMAEYINSDVIDQVIEGTLMPTIRGVNEPGTNVYLLFWNTAGEIERVQPFGI